MASSRAKAWATRRLRYGPRGHASSYHRGTTDSDAVLQRRRLCRLIAVVHAHDLMTEGQIAKAIDACRTEVRELEDDGRDILSKVPLQGHWGKYAMSKIR